jgi:diguanylate cyclase (GGDEF)-like protein
VLVEVARRLTQTVRDSDMVLRWGGEEFLIYAPATNPAFIADMVGRVLRTIGSTPVDAGSCKVPVTLSAGVVALPAAGGQQNGLEWQRAIRLADWALYQGKANGRNQAQIVVRVAATMDTVLAAIEESNHGALPAGLLELALVPGPIHQLS